MHVDTVLGDQGCQGAHFGGPLVSRPPDGGRVLLGVGSWPTPAAWSRLMISGGDGESKRRRVPSRSAGAVGAQQDADISVSG